MIKDIIFITTKFYEEGDESIYSLLKETGYFKFYNQVNESDIYKCLLLYPNCVAQWLSWSENKRGGHGWYFTKVSGDEYVVGYTPSDQNLASKKYSNDILACADFILREIEDIRLG